MKKQFLLSLAIIFFLFLGTAAVVLYGRGYRFGLGNGRVELTGTGILVTTSNPDGAQVLINGHLTTATDNTINLIPGKYHVKIFKEGYFPWEKDLLVKKEVVSKADALLFPTAPKLESITAIGVQNPVIDPSSTRLAYTVSSQSAKKNGIYILDMTQRPVLTLQNAATHIVDDTLDVFSNAELSWSPNGNQLLATILTSETTSTTYLLSTGGFNDNPQDVTTTLQTVLNTWEREITEKEQARITGHKAKLRKIILENFKILAWSGDEAKILYTASRSAGLPIIITPRHLGVDITPEDRNIKEGSVYVYDIKEDKNYNLKLSSQSARSRSAGEISQSSQSLNWFPDSEHLIYVNDQKIDIMELDGTNSTTLYAGPFVDSYVFSWPNSTKIVIVTNLGNSNIPATLYTIGLK